MLRGLIFGAALLALGTRASACSPNTYNNNQERLVDALRYYQGAEWVAVGLVTGVETLSPEAVWKRHDLDAVEDILSGIGPEAEPYLEEESPFGVKYSFKVIEEIKGVAPQQARVWLVDFPPSQHPTAREPIWPENISIGAHPNSPDCSIFPAFGLEQTVLLIRPKKVLAETNGGRDPEWDATFAALASRAHFRSLEPIIGDDEWYTALRAAAFIDRGNWPIEFGY